MIETISIALLTSTALFGFIQFMIARVDKKNDKLGEINTKLDGFTKQINGIEHKIDRRNAEQNRFRILKFADEIHSDIKHGKEHYLQMLDTIQEYDEYCETHEDFKNGRTVEASKAIKDRYKWHTDVMGDM